MSHVYDVLTKVLSKNGKTIDDIEFGMITPYSVNVDEPAEYITKAKLLLLLNEASVDLYDLNLTFKVVGSDWWIEVKSVFYQGYCQDNELVFKQRPAKPLSESNITSIF